LRERKKQERVKEEAITEKTYIKKEVIPDIKACKGIQK